MVVRAWCRDFVQLLNRFVRQLPISPHAFPCMNFHIIGEETVFVSGFPGASGHIGHLHAVGANTMD